MPTPFAVKVAVVVPIHTVLGYIVESQYSHCKVGGGGAVHHLNATLECKALRPKPVEYVGVMKHEQASQLTSIEAIDFYRSGISSVVLFCAQNTSANMYSMS